MKRMLHCSQMTCLIDNTVIKYKFGGKYFGGKYFGGKYFGGKYLGGKYFGRKYFGGKYFGRKNFGDKNFGGKAVNRIYIISHLGNCCGNSCDSQSKKDENPLFSGALFIVDI